MPPSLTCHKNRFPFPIALPSFIWPAGYAENVDRLGPLVDEVALLFFESQPTDSPPDADLVHLLGDLAQRHALTYNVHLPVDVNPGATDPERCARDVAALSRVLSATQCLSPSAWILHVEPLDPAESYDIWQNRLVEHLGNLLSIGVPSRRLCVETLDYPIDWLAQVIDGLDLGICLDLGHLFHHDLDPAPILDRWSNRVGMIHLHASADDRDHQPLDRLTRLQADLTMDVLEACDCPVTVETFSEEGAARSLKWLAERTG